MSVDPDGPAVFIHPNPVYQDSQEFDFYKIIETTEGKDELVKQIKREDENIERRRLVKNDLIDELEIEVLSLVNDYSQNYQENKILLRNTIKQSYNIQTKRKCLIHLLGGGTLAYHFLNNDGSYKTMYELDEEINKLLSWKGMTFQDYFIYNKIWKEMSFKLWLLLKIMSKSKFVLDYLHEWFKNTIVKSLSLAAASIYFLHYGENTYKNVMFSISILVIGFLSIYLYEGAYTLEEVNTINKNVIHIQENNNGITKETKEKIKLFKEEYAQLEKQIKVMREKSNDSLRIEIQQTIMKRNIFNLKRKNKRLIDFLLKYLDKESSLSEIYTEIRKQGILIPLAIFFFDNNGNIRSSRDIICCIMVISQHFLDNEYEHLKNPEIVPSYRKRNLVGKGYSSLDSKHLSNNIVTKKNLPKINKQSRTIKNYSH